MVERVHLRKIYNFLYEKTIYRRAIIIYYVYYINLILLLYFIKFRIMISKGTVRSLIIVMLIAFLFGLARKI